MEIALLITGGVLFWIGLAMIRGQNDNSKKHVIILGEVVGLIQEQKQGSTLLYPLVKFIWRGEEKFLKSSIGSSYARHKIGQKTPVRVSEGEKLEAEIDMQAMKSMAWILLLLGLSLSVIFFVKFQLNLFNLGISAVIVSQIFFSNKIKFKNLADLKNKMQVMLNQQIHPNIFTKEELGQLKLLEPTAAKALMKKQAVVGRRVGIVLTCLGLTCGYFAFNWHQKRLTFLKIARATTGVVVRMEESHSHDSHTYYPIVQYQHPATTTPIEFRHSVGSSPPSFHVGEKVKILYDHDNPKEAMIDQGILNQFFPLLCIALSALAALLGLKMTTKQDKLSS